jgi:hypothetical protein
MSVSDARRETSCSPRLRKPFDVADKLVQFDAVIATGGDAFLLLFRTSARGRRRLCLLLAEEEILDDAQELQARSDVRRVKDGVDDGRRGLVDHEHRMRAEHETETRQHGGFDERLHSQAVQPDEQGEREFCDRGRRDLVDGSFRVYSSTRGERKRR